MSEVMFAKKANKVYRVDETNKGTYLKQGYDILDEKGNVIEHSHQSTVKYAEYEKVKKELEELKAKEGSGNGLDVSTLTVDELLAEYAKAKGFDVGNATSADGILKKIKEAEAEQ